RCRAASARTRHSSRGNAQRYGSEILIRLDDALRKADHIGERYRQTSAFSFEEHAYMLDNVDAVWLSSNDMPVQVAYGRPSDSMLSILPDRAYLASGNVQLFVDGGSDEAHIVLLRTLNVSDGTFQTLGLALNVEALLGPREPSAFDSDYCVFEAATGLRLFCTDERRRPDSSHIAELADQGGAIPSIEWMHSGEPQLAAIWKLSLSRVVRGPALDIVASQPKAKAVESLFDYRHVLTPALLLVFMLVAVLSLNMIDRSLVPLQRLMTAAKQLATGDLGLRVRLRSGDEFEELAEAFNNMADRLGQQFDALKAMSDIDRLILSGAESSELARCLVRNLTGILDIKTAAVIARDNKNSRQASMITSCNGKLSEDEIELPEALNRTWYQPRQVSIDEVEVSEAPYADRFRELGIAYAIVIPVVLDKDLMGMILLGSSSRLSLSDFSTQRCVDLAGRFAVALSSAERADALFRKASFDDLTGLPNRQLLKERLSDMIEAARLEKHSGGILYLDLDRFKEINDVYGHSVGDIVLNQAAERIRSEVRDDDLVARLGGDEFVIVLPRIAGNERLKATASRILSRMGELFSVFGVNHFVGASVGIALFPDDGDSVETLLKNADSAMYRAKEAGRNRYEFYNVALNAESRRKIELERDLRAACDAEELEVYYQPQFSLENGVISGAEALLRWEHSEHGFVSPREFVPLAEGSDLIVKIGRWVIEQACADMRRILDAKLHPGPVSINVSARQLGDPGFVSDVIESLQRHAIHPCYLQLEVTETTVAQNRDIAIDILKRLRNHGIR
ncbi:MAG: diguanylate cyclase, partial [Pseudomonadota bacterium]